MRLLARHILKWSLLALGAFAMLAVVALVGFGIVMTRVPAYRAQLQEWLSERARLDIEFAELRARWRWYGPELVFEKAVLRSADRQRVLAVADRGGVGFDLWAALRTGRLTAGRFSLQGTELKIVRTPEGRLAVIGQEDLPERIEPLQADALPIGRLEVRDVRLSFRDLKTGRGPWVMRDVQFEVERSTRRMQLRGKAVLPRSLGRELVFSASSAGSLKDVETLQWQAQVNGSGIDLGGWSQVMPQEWHVPSTGRGAFQITASFRGAVPQVAHGSVDLSEVGVTLPQWSIPLPQADPLQTVPEESKRAAETGDVAQNRQVAAAESAPLVYTRAATNFRAQRSGDAWQLHLEQLQLARAGAEWPASTADFKWQATAAGGLRVEANADLLVLENLWPLFAYLQPSEPHARWRALDVDGRIQNLRVEAARDNADAPWRYQAAAQFSRLSIAPVGKWPGAGGLTGKLSASEAAGRIELDSSDFSLTLPRYFRTPLPVDRLAGAVAWQRQDNAWQISSDGLTIDNSDGHAQATLQLQVPDEGSPIIDMRATATAFDASAAPRYMPAGKLSEKTLAWLDRAFTAGRISTAELTLQGPMRNFPFRNNEGLFLIRGQFEGLTLDYQPGWTPATELVGQVEFRNAGMTATASSGTLNGLKIGGASARFKDFKEAVLELKATGSGELRQALEYLQQSPLGPQLGDLFQALRATGPMNSEASLVLPFKNIAKRRVNVLADIKGAEVGLDGWDVRAAAVQGSLRVRDQAIADMTLSGRVLQGPFAVTTTSIGDKPVFIASGRAAASELASFLKLPAFVSLQGNTDWRVSTTGFGAAAAGADATLFTVDSDLSGLSIGLPAPLGKQPAEKRHLHLTAERSDNALLLRSSLEALRAVALIKKQAGGWQFDRAGVRADAVAASLPAHTGLRIEGAIDQFVLDDWLALAKRKGSGTGQVRQPLQEILRAANVRVGRFQFGGFVWTDLRGVLQAADQNWRVDLSGPQASGQVLVPFDLSGSRPLVLDMERLTLQREETRSGGDADSALDPRDIPALQVDVKQFRYDNHDFGALQMRADKVPQGLQVNSLRAGSTAFQASGNGSWWWTPLGQISNLQLDFESTDLGAALRQLNYADFIEGRHARLHADLRWPGGLDAKLLGRASGTLEISAEDGQLLNVQPGAGRVLGLLSVATLPRRLSLDFRDLTDKGLRFDTIHGNFTVTNGDARTDNLLLRGPAAEIGIAGRLGFAARDYDQTAVVTGNVGSTLPVAGVLAGGPVVGAALLVFTQIFKEPLKGVARGYYHITGNWDNPNVERIDAAEAKENREATSTETP